MRTKDLVVWALLTLVAGILTGLTMVSAQEQKPPATPEQPKLEAPAADVDFSGMYTVLGKNPDDTFYKGHAVIQRMGQSVYAVYWLLPNDVEVKGVGIAENGTLSVSSYGDHPIIAVYRRLSETTISGEWAVYGVSETGVETLTRMPAGTSMPEPRKPTSPSEKPIVKTAV